MNKMKGRLPVSTLASRLYSIARTNKIAMTGTKHKNRFMLAGIDMVVTIVFTIPFLLLVGIA